jgi:hypothetical protein
VILHDMIQSLAIKTDTDFSLSTPTTLIYPVSSILVSMVWMFPSQVGHSAEFMQFPFELTGAYTGEKTFPLV